MTSAGFVWANLRRRPMRVLMTFAAVGVAFVLYALALGIAEGIRLAAIEQRATASAGLLPAAVGIAASGMALTLVLTVSAMAHEIHGRTRELGVLSAIGFSPRRIFLLLVAEGAVPCVAGAACGFLGAKALLAVLVAALPALGILPAPVYTTSVIAMAFALALFIATAGALLSFRRLAKATVILLMRGPLPSTASALVAGNAQADEARDTAVPPASASRENQRSAVLDLRLLRQVAVVTRVGLSTLPLRLRGALLIVGSVGAVVFLLLTPLSTAEGIRFAIRRSGDPERVVLRSASAILLDNSRVSADVAALVADAPGIARSADGSPLVDSELFTWPTGLVKRNDGKNGYLMLVGVGPRWTEMTPTFRLLSGRLPRPGHRELIAGKLAARKFSSLDSERVQLTGKSWRIVGTFSTASWWDGYLVSPAVDVRAVATSSAGTAVRVRLNSTEDFAAFRDTVAARLPPSIAVERETDYYAGLWRRVPKHLVYLVLIFAALMSAGAALGTALVTHNAMDDRRQEIATLRLLGFDARAAAASVLIEGLCLALLGAATGAAAAWACFDGRLINGAWNVVAMRVDLPLLCLALTWGAGIALAGTLPVALHTLRSSVLDAIRDLFVALRRALDVSMQPG